MAKPGAIEECLANAKVQADEHAETATATMMMVRGLDQFAARFARAIVERTRSELTSGVLAARWGVAIEEAQKGGLTGEEAQLAAVSSLLLEAARDAGRMLQAETRRAEGEARVHEGKATALRELAQLVEEATKAST